MSSHPYILVIDDVLGRSAEGRENADRSDFCAQFQLSDCTGDDASKHVPRVRSPIACAVFCSGQSAGVRAGHREVENDPDLVRSCILTRWPSKRAQPPWALVLLDLSFPVHRQIDRLHGEGRTVNDVPSRQAPTSLFGLTLLDLIRTEFPGLPVVVVSGRDSSEVSLDLSRRGACGFIPRGSPDACTRLAEYMIRHALLPDPTEQVLGSSVQLLLALRRARLAAMTNRHVMLLGERGTGKELFARYIHGQTRTQGGRPYVTVNCGTLGRELYASALFGYVKGAFTGATTDRAGHIVHANGGDLFLDEIGRLASEGQAGLLRTIEYGEVVPVGATVGVDVSVRVIAATNEDLEAHSLSGEFRADLLDRLQAAGPPIVVPPLRERVDDIAQLSEVFTRMAEAATPGALRRHVEPEAVEMLCDHDWPGNVRELKSCITNAVSENPFVEHLVAEHLHIRSRRELASDIVQGGVAQTVQPSDLRGFLDRFERRCADSIQAALVAAANSTARMCSNSTSDTSLRVMLQPTMRLLTGRSNLTTMQAADVLKRLLSRMPDLDSRAAHDPVLSELISSASRLRPSRARSKPQHGGSSEVSPK